MSHDEKTTKEEKAKKEEERIERFKNIKIGNKDSSGRTIYDVYAKGDEYAIYSVNKSRTINGISYLIDTKDPDDEVPINNFQKIRAAYNKLKGVSNKTSEPSYAARVSHALSSGILGNTEHAIKTLEDIYNSIEEEYKELVVGKLKYISGTFIIAVLFSTLSMYLYMFADEAFIKEKKAIYELILISTSATLGGLISVAKGVNSINVDKGLGTFIYLLYGIGRSIYSALGGMFIYLLIKADLLFGFINDLSFYVMLVFGFLAGFSETFIPNALKKLEEKTNNG